MTAEVRVRDLRPALRHDARGTELTPAVFLARADAAGLPVQKPEELVGVCTPESAEVVATASRAEARRGRMSGVTRRARGEQG